MFLLYRLSKIFKWQRYRSKYGDMFVTPRDLYHDTPLCTSFVPCLHPVHQPLQPQQDDLHCAD